MWLKKCSVSIDLCHFPPFCQSYQPCPVSAGYRPSRTYPSIVALSLNAKRPVWQRRMDAMLSHYNSAFLCLSGSLCSFKKYINIGSVLEAYTAAGRLNLGSDANSRMTPCSKWAH